MKEKDLNHALKQYRSGQRSLLELEDWITSREEYWASLPSTSPERQAVDDIMLAVYERQAGHRTEESVAAVVHQALTKLEAAQRV